MTDIVKLLNDITDLIERDDFAIVPELINRYVSEDPSAVDERFKAELSMIEKMLDYKSNLRDWAYFRMMRLTYQYVESKYASALSDNDIEYEDNTLLPDRDVIWCSWLQGEDNAPDIVRKCLRSLRRFGRKIILLTDDNISEHIEIPDYIYDKKKKGMITNTHFTDILRAELLSERGGTWIDATVYCSNAENIEQIFKRYPFFCYSFAMRDSISDSMLFDSWLIHSSNKSAILNDTRDMLRMYWQNENSLLHYFLFHLIFTISCRRHPKELGRIPIYSLEPCHMLQKELGDPFDEFRWRAIMNMSGIHKLTYKYDPFDIRGTMLEHLMKELDPV